MNMIHDDDDDDDDNELKINVISNVE